MAVIDIRINAQNNASRQLLQLRANMNALNRTLADQRVALSKATGEERSNIQSKINATRAAQTQNRLEQQTLSLKRQFIAQGQREAKQASALEREHAKLSQSIETTSRNYGGWLDRLANSAYIYSVVGHQLTNLIRSTVQVGAETERYQAVLRATEVNSGAVYRQLQLLNRELIGTDFATINRTFLSLRAAGLGLNQTITTVRGLSRALGQLQVDAYDQQRFFTQLTQSYAQNKLELDEFKILQETLPNVLRLSSRALNTEIRSYEQLKDVLESGNQSARDYYETLASFSEQNIAGIDPTTYTAQVEQFRESVKEIQREISSVLIPILARGAGEARNLVETFGGTSRGDIAAFVTSIISVTGVVKLLSAAYTQWNLASQLTNATTLTTGANMARLTIVGQGLTLGLRTMTANLAANLAAWNAAGIGMGGFLSIATLTTTAIGYFAVKAAVARNRADAFTQSMTKLSDAFKDAEGRSIRFADLEADQLKRSINIAITERERLAAAISSLVSENINTASVIPLPEGNLAPSLDNLSEFIVQLERLRTALDAHADEDPYKLRQFEALDRTLKDLKQLSIEYEVATKNVGRLEKRLKEMDAAQRSASQTSADQAKSVGELQVALARADQRLTQTGSALRQALAGDDVSAIRAATAAEVLELEKRAAIRQRLLTAEGKEREASEKNTLKDKAEGIRIETRLSEERARLQERTLTRIEQIEKNRRKAETQAVEKAQKAQTKAVEDALKKQREATEDFHKQILSVFKESADANIAEQKRITSAYNSELDKRREGEERTSAARVALAQRRTAENQKALETARALARLDQESGRFQRSRGAFETGSGLSQQTPATGSRELFNRAYQEYQRAFQQFQRTAGSDFEERIATALPGFQQRIQEQMQAGSQAVMSKIQQDSEAWQQHQKRVYREMARDARQWSRIVTGFVDDVAISRNRGIKEALVAFLLASVKRILQDTIETQILIANQKRYQKELAKTAALAASRSNTSIVSAAVSGLAAGNPIVAGLSALLPAALSVFVQIGEGQIQEQTNLQNKIDARRKPR